MPTNKEIAEVLRHRIESSGGGGRIIIGTTLAWEIVRRLLEKDKKHE